MSQRTIHVRATVGPDHAIHIPAGDLPVGDEVAVTIEHSDPDNSAGDGKTDEDILDIIESVPPCSSFPTAEEADEYLRQERDSWDR